MIEEDLIHCIYSSSPSPGVERSELEHILEKARKNNDSLGVSGMLLFDDGALQQTVLIRETGLLPGPAGQRWRGCGIVLPGGVPIIGPDRRRWPIPLESGRPVNRGW